MSDLGKVAAGNAAADMVTHGMRLGLGTGSTAECMLRALATRVRAGLRVVAVPTSERTARLAAELGIALTTLDETPELDLCIDGADEIDPAFGLIKGGGGALLREKIVASAAARFVVIADDRKCVDSLGAFPLPVEVSPFALRPVGRRLAELGARTTVRTAADGGAFVTDEGNRLIDCAFGRIVDAPALARRLDAMVGVVEHGLFVGMADEVLVGHADGSVDLFRREA